MSITFYLYDVVNAAFSFP